MGSTTDLMQLFRKALKRYEGYIRMTTGHRKFDFESGKNGEFTLVLSGGKETHRFHFTRHVVLGSTASKPPLEQRLEKRPCDFVREIIAKAR